MSVNVLKIFGYCTGFVYTKEFNDKLIPAVYRWIFNMLAYGSFSEALTNSSSALNCFGDVDIGVMMRPPQRLPCGKVSISKRVMTPKLLEPPLRAR